MQMILIAVCAGLFLLWLITLVLLLKSKSAVKRAQGDLKRVKEITDFETHIAKQKADVEEAIAQTARSKAELAQLKIEIAAHQQAMTNQIAQVATQQEKLSSISTMLGGYQTLGEINSQVEKLKETANKYNQVLGNFKTAGDLKTHIAEQRNRIDELKQTVGKFESLEELNREAETRHKLIADLENRINDMKDVLGGAKTAGDLKTHIAEQRNRIDELKQTIGKFESLEELNRETEARQKLIADMGNRINDMKDMLGGAKTIVELNSQIREQQTVLANLSVEARKVEETLVMQEFGFYQPRYNFDTSEKYQERLEFVRFQQTSMAKNDLAVKWEKQWIVEGSDAKGRKMMAEQTKLMLRAFNGECDAAVAKVKYNNATSLESRIMRSHEQINKFAKTNSAEITDAFLKLKLEELYLVHEHRVKQQDEKEEQQRIRDQMREEEKAQREFEEEEARAAKEEAAVERALQKAQRELEEATRGQIAVNEETKAQNTLLGAQVQKLKDELSEAIDRKAKAIARAQLTKSGYVYVLSNVGSFGDNCYKLGLTRRLDPLDRVKELGDASVPFPFDVHAIIYSDNAPELENSLHKHFAHRRVNLINNRREYFHATLEEIMAAIKQHYGEITFVLYPEAAEYRETIAKRKTGSVPPLPFSLRIAGEAPEVAVTAVAGAQI